MRRSSPGPLLNRNRARMLSSIHLDSSSKIYKLTGRRLRATTRAFLLTACLLAVTSCRPDSAGPKGANGDMAGYYAGQTSDGRAMFLRIERNETNLDAGVALEGTSIHNRLRGAMPSANRLILELDDFAKEVDRQTVTNLTATFRGMPARMEGRLDMPGSPGGVTFTATNVASIQERRRNLGLKLAGRGGGKEFNAHWPKFRGLDPFLKAVTAKLEAEARAEAGLFASGGLRTAWDGFRWGGVTWSWERSSNVQIAWLSQTCLSLYQENSEYTGGAHSHESSLGRNFLFRDGKLSEFGLTNLFRAGSGWEDELADLCVPGLGLQTEGWFKDGGAKELMPDDMAAFTFDRRGLQIHFQTYVVGPYSDGLRHVFLPWSELRPMLDPSGPARFVPGALGRE